ncbi:hypothetical protein I6N90_21930 [Paenibacillus sp. GSMTC-2017]|uniref:hypothetical protein n=1 Tax=Paenibacillus sp. GSMTC-2017 TaxID=2794350 RepID=UPI0018D82F63|nr:hypothetical protein [Paenibacillus sp. GSMTC-2017]MBH5320458.1 hypothetical protein [Paenibacillus sp. GSMTC-2017]
MKRWVSLFLLTIFVCVLIIYSLKEAEIIRNMVAHDAGYYSIYVFCDDNSTDSKSITNNAISAIEPEDMRLWLEGSSVTFVSLSDEKKRKSYSKIINITKSPTYIIMDHREIVLETNDPKAISKMLMERKGTKIKGTA